ncbi:MULTISPECIES: hypothetical protein [unclassified Crossiella]|uniref:hypothetical protein n=1 Tax=unclassified Crossiella TaxID=2620835 RepID=UPI001FFE7FC6|nr:MULTISPECIES: hypothetical protein [unclassified Crossiella]MCK2240395.1 hypothetical protein [Crossiella sp. S99.2]MCK2253153.1 hypothetical protein [Crossiella sp. S99.1]
MTQVPLWVPVAVGLLGFLGVLGAQFIAAWREDRRWNREKSRDEDNKRFDARRTAYAEVIGALESWDWVLHPLKDKARGKDLEIGEPELVDLRTAWIEAKNVLGPINLVATTEIRDLLRTAMIARSRLSRELTADGPENARLELVEKHWAQAQDAYARLRNVMRRDLGFEPVDPQHSPAQPRQVER